MSDPLQTPRCPACWRPLPVTPIPVPDGDRDPDPAQGTTIAWDDLDHHDVGWVSRCHCGAVSRGSGPPPELWECGGSDLANAIEDRDAEIERLRAKVRALLIAHREAWHEGKITGREEARTGQPSRWGDSAAAAMQATADAALEADCDND